MSGLKGKYNIELNIPGDGRLFLNFWNWYNGMDVVAEIKDGELEIETSDDQTRKIEFKEFLQHVIDSIKTIPPQ
jgi:hypothetical protein